MPPAIGAESALTITDVEVFPTSFAVPPERRVRLGVGEAVKRDAVVVKVSTAGGLTGWGESHHGRAPGTVAHLLRSVLRPLALGRDAADVNGLWREVFRRQIAAMGLGTAAVIAHSGLDMALWDLRAKAAGWPLYRLLGGRGRGVKAYAGGVALGWQDPAALADEAQALVARGYRAVKLRLGESPALDIARVQAVRARLGDGVVILTDANCAYGLDEARRVIPALDEAGIGWLEEPFPPQARRAWQDARAFGRLAFAAGENHYGRFEFQTLIDDGVVEVLQPDLSKTGGITETLRIAAMASARRLQVHLHSSMTGINLAASLHVLAALEEDAGWFEADASAFNRFRDELVQGLGQPGADGGVRPPEGPGLGITVDEDFLRAHPCIDGPAYV